MRTFSNTARLLSFAVVLAALSLTSVALPAAATSHPSSDPSQITVVGTSVFFAATTAAHGRELWVTDGTKAGTHEVADINPTPGIGSDPDQLTAGSKVYFFADDGTGTALWKSDGTTAGTKRLGGGAGSGLTNVNGTLFFLVANSSDITLWKSNGTIAGTRAIATIEDIDDWGPVAGLGGYYYFFSQPWPDDTWSLWRSDGTPAGTSVVTQVSSGYAPSYDQMVASGNLVYFLMEETGWAPCRGPADLWESDGTAAGTHQVRDFDDVDYGLTDLGGTLYFGAEDEIGDALWKSDGTDSGTRIVKGIDPSRDCGDAVMTAVGSRLFFFAWDGSGEALWRTRGTARTTVKVYPISPPGCAMYSNEPYCYLDGTPVAVGSRLFFPAGSTGYGIELWVSDGTTAGTHMVKNIGYRGIGSQPSDLATDGTRLFFSARDTTHGRELWVSNGTARGTYRVLDINPG